MPIMAWPVTSVAKKAAEHLRAHCSLMHVPRHAGPSGRRRVSTAGAVAVATAHYTAAGFARRAARSCDRPWRGYGYNRYVYYELN